MEAPSRNPMVVFDNSIFCLVLHPNAKPRTTVDRVKERVDFLVETLAAEQERIILPAPVFAEFLVFAGQDGPEYIRKIRDNSVFRIEPFDDRAAIELAQIELDARAAGNKRGAAENEPWQKVKFDRQIVAIAKVHGASRIYSDDPDLKNHGNDCGIAVVDLSGLPLPPAVQVELDLDLPDQPQESASQSDSPGSQQGGDASSEAQSSAETGKETA